MTQQFSRFSLISILMLLVVSCGNDDDDRRRNPFVTTFSFSVPLDLNLPQYSNLQFPGNVVVDNNLGLRGVIIYNLNNEQYLAWEATDPSHIPETCSRLEVDGLTVRCMCNDGNEYSLVTGQPLGDTQEFGLINYAAIRTGNVLTISN